MIAQRQTWPTPNASDHRDRGGPENPSIQRRQEIGKSIELSMTQTGQLNPDWVEWLMGWPIGWTSLESMPSDTVERWKAQRDGLWAEDPADDSNSHVRRTSTGIAKRIDRLKAIGNGQVPLVAATAWQILSKGIEV